MDVLELLELLFALLEDEEGLFLYLLLLDWEVLYLIVSILFDCSIAFCFSSSET